MVLDPVSTLGVAGNVLQIVHLGTSIVKATRAFHQHGTTPHYAELAANAESVNRLSRQLQKHLDPLQNAQGEPWPEFGVQNINESCQTLSQDLAGLLQRHSLRDSNLNAMQSFRNALKSVWGDSKIQNLERNLENAQEQLLLHLSAHICVQVTSSTRILQLQVKEIETNILREVKKRVKEEPHWLQAQLKPFETDLDSQTSTERAQLKASWQQEHYINLVSLAEHEKHKYFAAQMLAYLYFTKIEDRRISIMDAHIKTFDWILDTVTDNALESPRFTDWLNGSYGYREVFWIGGKAGSGKSTLMRWLTEHQYTKSILETWAGTKKLLVLHCFFWNLGSPLQKSLNGFFRTALYQTVQQFPELASLIFRGRWEAFCGGTATHEDFSDAELAIGFRNAILNTTDTVKVALFVDGLDEFTGKDEHRQQVTDLLQSIARSEDVRICVSSRPWNMFTDAFQHSPQLRLELLTKGDIAVFVEDKLRENEQFKELEELYESECAELIKRLVQKASGVFLWVHLVVRDILKAVRDGNGLRALFKKLDEIPDDLNQYFLHMMYRIPERDRPKAAAIFQLMVQARKQPDLMTLSFIEEDDPNFALNDYIKEATHAQVQHRNPLAIRKINSISMGFLECTRPEDKYAGMFLAENVQYFHRSVQEFLVTPEAQVVLVEFTEDLFVLEQFLCNSFLGQLFFLNNMINFLIVYEVAKDLAAHLLVILDEFLFYVGRLGSGSSCSTTLVREGEKIVRTHQTLLARVWHSGRVDSDLRSVILDPSDGSMFLKTAISRGLDFCADDWLVPEAVQNDIGDRPLLDCALLSIVAIEGKEEIAARIRIIAKILDLGADPNQQVKGFSIWVRFLATLPQIASTITRAYWADVVKFMIQAGAHVGVLIISGRKTTAMAEVERLFPATIVDDLRPIVAAREDMKNQASRIDESLDAEDWSKHAQTVEDILMDTKSSKMKKQPKLRILRQLLGKTSIR